MNDRQRKIESLKIFYKRALAENRKNNTSFDKEVLNALDRLFDAHRDVAVPPECMMLGFILKSKCDGSRSCGCLTIPCAGGKMPYQKMPDVLCSEINSSCGRSPYERVMIAARHKSGDER